MTNTDELVITVAREIYYAGKEEPYVAYSDLPFDDREKWEMRAREALRKIGFLDGTNMLIPNWRDISEAPKDGQCLVLTPEGHDISEYSEAEPDYPDQMGHDAGWWGMLTPADPGRSFGSPEYRREPTCQPTHFIPLSSIPTPEKADG